MFDTTSTRSNASSIFEGLLAGAPASRASAAARNLETRSFSEEMAETQASAEDVAAAAAPAPADTVTPPATTNPVTDTDQNLPRQDSVTAAKSSPAAAATGKAKEAVAAPSATADPVSTPTENTPKTPIEILQDVMKAQGIDPGKYKMESFEELVMYPGGSYMHRYTQVDLPNGYQEKFSTDLMSKFPEVTVNELARIMKMGADGPVTGLV